jgi:DNA-binding CsgD family transcriptional regulator
MNSIKTVTIKPLSPQVFIEKIKTSEPVKFEIYFDYFKPYIDSIPDLAIGRFFWLIADNHQGRIVEISENVNELTPFSREQWLTAKDPAMHFASFMYPPDSSFIFSASEFSMSIANQLLKEYSQLKMSIYARFLNAKKEYQWMIGQVVKHYFDSDGICQAILSLYTDISHLSLNENSPFMTVLASDGVNEQNFKVYLEKGELEQLNIPKISKREKHILKLMAKGMKTPDIVAELGIAYNTVENHKRNLREKTNTKTSVELMNYVLKNHLID